ncbi:hypothetical protein RRG08_003627 [Elysia crispata]|uniref:Uncharacterized protein n=1 Tax=Elysia crispata TaxID=231223 RepID=A0AAE1E4W2_9GAST|nr:hypothetical protein RRG08_003627 [Elysia crispata]
MSRSFLLLAERELSIPRQDSRIGVYFGTLRCPHFDILTTNESSAAEKRRSFEIAYHSHRFCRTTRFIGIPWRFIPSTQLPFRVTELVAPPIPRQTPPTDPLTPPTISSNLF